MESIINLNEKKNGKKTPRTIVSLTDLVLSWSMSDIFNKDLYKPQVEQIPKTFSSSLQYLKSFKNPLIEETRVGLCSSLSTLSESLCCEIESIEESKGFRPPKGLYYTVKLKERPEKRSEDEDEDEDETGYGDLIAITNVKPKRFGDLDRPRWPYLVAIVQGVNDKYGIELSVLSSRPIVITDDENDNKTDRKDDRRALYAVKLMNMITNLRIWDALNSDPKTGNFKVIERVLQTPFSDTEGCDLCKSCEDNENGNNEHNAIKSSVVSSDLNESQKSAVLSCIATRECRHGNTVKLIWGPPGTGKTKTVGVLLHSLLKMKCRALICAPTNIAVLEVTKRLVKGVAATPGGYGYGLGDVVLVGNKKRMKVERQHPELLDVFLNHRVKVLALCYDSFHGWKANLTCMISLLKDPVTPHKLYLRDRRRQETTNMTAQESKIGEKIDCLNRKKSRKNNFKKDSDNKSSSSSSSSSSRSRSKKVRKQVVPDEKNDVVPLIGLGEFVRSRFNSIVQRLYFCLDNLYLHLPTSHISRGVVNRMFVAFNSLKHLERSLRNLSNEDLTDALSIKGDNKFVRFEEFGSAKAKSLAALKLLPLKLREPYDDAGNPDLNREVAIRTFLLENAYMIFCTASGSAKLHGAGVTNHFELVIIDEAAQLKECESTIPLQLPGVHHAILIGDEKQLPAMVQSKISEEVDFGRSLFERLALLGHKKLLLNVQHRMHPSISVFPNREFYGGMISDGENVKLEKYSRTFLTGRKIFGSYSFINVPYGKEEFDNKHSTRNAVEVAVVADIVASLHREYLLTKKRVRLGVISPYKAQVRAMAEKFGKRYGNSDAESEFSVSVRSVDGFQGGEEDVIIISTVRCNVGGNVGFLSNLQRANVALTRARYCLWIVGSGTTLGNSDSVWKELIANAKERSCFHNAEEDRNLARAIVLALLGHNRIDVLVAADSLLFGSTATWKVCFTEGFWRSMGRLRDEVLENKVFSLLEKLSSGWRQPENKLPENRMGGGGSSSLFIEQYEVTKQLSLVWAVDVIEQSSDYTQVLKIWDVLLVRDVPRLANQLNDVYGSYTLDKTNRCKHRLDQGNLVVPMKWPVKSGSHNPTNHNHAQSLAKPMASLNLSDKPETSSTKSRDQKKLRKSESSVRNQNWKAK